ncbi:MAG TPA: alpha/beta fold hydrolase [Solirubrobacteraceae bacterium]|jgi:pimeloyl-ACP methyl ester carboxylesterase|nr:alpha/beta fold hydrolase [Solirubrobacteraceae bacterium]
MPDATVHGQRLHYIRRGAGDPLLLIMGMSGNHLNWGEPLLSELERDFDVIAYDHRGTGRSARLEGAISIVEMANDAAGLLEALDLECAHVLGISMGGMVAQELVLLHPQRVRTLALGCTYAGGPGSSLARPEVLDRLAAGMRTGDLEAAVRTGFEINVSAAYAADPGHYEQFAETAMVLPTAVPVIMAQMQAIARHNTSARLSLIAKPTLVVHGTEDQMVPVSNARLIAEAIPGARLEIMEGVGHLFFWERPQRSAELMRELTGSVTPSPAPAVQ